MTSLRLRTDPGQIEQGADYLLDWFSERSSSTVAYEPRFLKGLRPSAVARELFRLAGAIYCADKLVKRREAADYWTRDLGLEVPVSDVALWERAKPALVQALTFLSGDRWAIDFIGDSGRIERTEPVLSEHDQVSLFSGGLDSLAGAVDALEAGRRVMLVGHHESPLADNKQAELYNALRALYGDDRVVLRRLYLRPSRPRPKQVRPLPHAEENTTRSRSFLFFAAGLVVADALGATVPLVVPENGFIGINVPLTAARSGSLSTRTTHPLFMHQLRSLGLQNVIENPYRLLTKGEVLEQSANRELLLDLAPRSISCSHPEAPRWASRGQGNCGYCYPCLVRRASLHRVNSDTASEYKWDALIDATLLARHSVRGRSLRALTASLGQEERCEDVLRNGRVPGGETEAFFHVYQRGRAELRHWLDGAGPELGRRLRAI